MLAMFCAAGKNVYRKNYAKYRRYILYEGNQTPPPGELYEPLPASETATALHEFSTTDTLLFVNAGVTISSSAGTPLKKNPTAPGFDLSC